MQDCIPCFISKFWLAHALDSPVTKEVLTVSPICIVFMKRKNMSLVEQQPASIYYSFAANNLINISRTVDRTVMG